MTSVIRCTTCRHRSQYYSYEWADRTGVLDGSWRCPSCGGTGSDVIVAPFGDPRMSIRAYQRVDAVLRALAVIGETTLTAEMLDRDAILEFDGVLRTALETAARQPRAGTWTAPPALTPLPA